MSLLDAIFDAIFRGVKLPAEPPRPVRNHERYPGIGPLRWWDKTGPDEFKCRACGHTTRTWRGMQSHCRTFGHRQPSA